MVVFLTQEKGCMLESRSRWVRPEIVLLALGIGLLLWLVGEVLLMVFAGVLLATALSALAGGLVHWTPLGRGWALVLVTLSLAVILIALGFAIVPQAIEELGTLVQRLMEIAGAVQQWVQELPVFSGGDGDGDNDGNGGMGTIQEAAGAAAGIVMRVLGTISTMVVVIVIGIFMAADPGLYTRGLLKLTPLGVRSRASEALSLIGYVLRWWLLGQLVSMTVLGVLTAAGLYLIGIELWLGLAALTAILTFVPFLGPIIAGIPIVAIAFADGIETGLIVLAFFVSLQSLEGYILTPMIQQRAVLMPPALLISMQVLFGTLFGAPGLILAAPLTAAGLVAVNLLYVEDVLGDRRAVPDKEADAEADPVPTP
jgi:predicted PurR-regulated permease PerM